ncbi:N-acetylneuraminate synthase family protein [Alphaproteobacteria bacterium]|nr:N-acetylneuraminate synthase family protein [Alphaproteobacteria bacterium]
MNLVQDLTLLSIFEDETLFDALQKISDNKKGFLVVISHENRLIGTLTDGDIRRSVIINPTLDLTVKVGDLCNKQFDYVNLKADKHLITEKVKKYSFCPLIDDNRNLLGIYANHPTTLSIDGINVTNESPCYIIAEIGNNHNGDVKIAKQLVELAKEVGANCVKFQMRDMATLYKYRKDDSEDLGTQYVIDLLDRFQLSDDQLYDVFDFAKKIGITPLCTPWDLKSLEKLEAYGFSAYKVASADLTNTPFLEALIETKKALIISTGMSTDKEILEASELLNSKGSSYILLHCNSSYPVPFEDINLNYMNVIKSVGNGLVGYSGHERDINVSVAAVALGAKIIERHITLDINMEGSDHKVSLLPIEFKNMVTGIRQVEKALNYSKNKNLNQGEIMNREILGKSIFVSAPIKEGEVFSYENLCVSAPGKGLQPNKFPDVIGKTAQKDFCVGDNIFQSDISETSYQYKDWKFNLKHGLPVRYHDFEKLYQKRNFEIVEFHLSYKDLELNPYDYLSGEYEQDLIVHCPELFANDHILDLASEDKNYLNVSLKNLDKTIHETLRIAKFFPKTKLPLLIVNVGGFTSDKFLDNRQNEAAYDRVANVLKEFCDTGVEIIPQTMPPFPWHFGGQRYHNLFVKNDEIVRFCENNGVRVCFDISHSKLACNYYNIDFFDFIKDMSAVTAHLHIVDAKGISGEGLQIGEGEIRFKETFPIIENKFINKSFVPEIWQGHKNNGQGFWQAFNQLS